MRSDNMALYRDLTLYNFVYIESGWLLLSFEMRAMTIPGTWVKWGTDSHSNLRGQGKQVV